MAIPSNNNVSEGFPKICIVGAGFSGILAGIKLKTELKLTNFLIFDQNLDVGGVWLQNIYPGCECDAPSHLYSYSFEPKNWSANYAPQAEILDYLQHTAKKYSLYSYMQFNSQVNEVEWVEVKGQWRVSVYNKSSLTKEEHFFDILINSPGALRVPNIPEHFKNFKGPIFHSAEWNSSIDLRNKDVGVVGSGASGTQIIPQLAGSVKELHCYQRSPPWVMPKRNFKFSSCFKWLFDHFPILMLLYRWYLFWTMEIFYPAVINGSFRRKIGKWNGRRHLRNQIQNDALHKALTPKVSLACCRTIVSNDYYPTFTRPNVHLYTNPIVAVHSNGIEIDGEETVMLDALILATGFRVQEYFAPMKIIDKYGRDLLSVWINDRPRGYLGIMSSCAPNHFGLLGPHTGLGHNSVLFMVECQMNYIIQLIGKMIRSKAQIIELRQSVEDAEMKLLEVQMKKVVWGNGTCEAASSWYQNSNGLNTTLWPWSCVNYWRRTRKANFSDFEFIKIKTKF